MKTEEIKRQIKNIAGTLAVISTDMKPGTIQLKPLKNRLAGLAETLYFLAKKIEDTSELRHSFRQRKLCQQLGMISKAADMNTDDKFLMIYKRR